MSEICQGPLHAMAIEGMRRFNAGQYWEAHEALEEAWMEEPGELRELYRGILQVGVAYLHIQRRNYPGVIKLYNRSQRWLTRFPDVCRGVEVGRLRADLEAAVAQVRALGPERLDEFDPALLRPVIWHETDTN